MTLASETRQALPLLPSPLPPAVSFRVRFLPPRPALFSRSFRSLSPPPEPRSPRPRPRVFRELTFLENKATIDAHNALPGVTFKLGYTQFADKSVEEFTRNQLRYKQRHSLREKRADKLYRAEAAAAAATTTAATAAATAAAAAAALPGGVTVSREGVAHMGAAHAKQVSEFPAAFDWAKVPQVMAGPSQIVLATSSNAL